MWPLLCKIFPKKTSETEVKECEFCGEKCQDSGHVWENVCAQSKEMEVLAMYALFCWCWRKHLYLVELCIPTNALLNFQIKMWSPAWKGFQKKSSALGLNLLRSSSEKMGGISGGNKLPIRLVLGYGLGHVFNDVCASLWFTYLLIFLQKVNSPFSDPVHHAMTYMYLYLWLYTNNKR